MWRSYLLELNVSGVRPGEYQMQEPHAFTRQRQNLCSLISGYLFGVVQGSLGANFDLPSVFDTANQQLIFSSLKPEA